MGRSGRGSGVAAAVAGAAAWMERRGRGRGRGGGVCWSGRRGRDRGWVLLLLQGVWLLAAAMESTIAIRSASGRGSFGGHEVAGASELVARSLFPSILPGKVPSFRESRRKMAWVGGGV